MLSKYRENLRVEGDKVYSYDTHVATIKNGVVYRLGWWSVTTNKHINYVASEYGYPVQDLPKEEKAVIQKEEEAKSKAQFDSVKMVCAFGSILCDTPEEKNKWNKRMLGTIPGIDFPEDFDKLSEEEKAKRLNGALNVLK